MILVGGGICKRGWQILSRGRARTWNQVAAVGERELQNVDGHRIDVGSITSDLHATDLCFVEFVTWIVRLANRRPQRWYEGLCGSIALRQRRPAYRTRAAVAAGNRRQYNSRVAEAGNSVLLIGLLIRHD